MKAINICYLIGPILKILATPIRPPVEDTLLHAVFLSAIHGKWIAHIRSCSSVFCIRPSWRADCCGGHGTGWATPNKRLSAVFPPPSPTGLIAPCCCLKEAAREMGTWDQTHFIGWIPSTFARLGNVSGMGYLHIPRGALRDATVGSSAWLRVQKKWHFLLRLLHQTRLLLGWNFLALILILV